MVQRARFRPALDADGRAIVATFSSRFHWRIPAATGPVVEVTISRDAVVGYRCIAAMPDGARAMRHEMCQSLATAYAKQSGQNDGVISLQIDPQAMLVPPSP
jgi:hypothetical protein